GHVPVLQLLSLLLFAGLLVAILVEVSKASSSHGEKLLMQEEISEGLTQLKASVARLCRPCPWEWMSFQGNCYFFSNSQRKWQDSVTGCEEMGAQLVIVRSDEEQSFLKAQTTSSNRYNWIGLSDLKHEDVWHWVDDSPLQTSFTKFWNRGEPNNIGEEDCVELNSNGWNDAGCDVEKFWVCKKSAASCSSP
ncbi:CD209 antigen-like protein 2, partial [Tupaia chinensis]